MFQQICIWTLQSYKIHVFLHSVSFFTTTALPYYSFIMCLDQWHLWQANNPNSTECFIRTNIQCKNFTLFAHKCFCHFSKQCIRIVLLPRTLNICVYIDILYNTHCCTALLFKCICFKYFSKSPVHWGSFFEKHPKFPTKNILQIVAQSKILQPNYKSPKSQVL